MSIEQLQLILNAVRDVSGAAQVVAILWVLKGYFMFTLGMGVVIYATAKIYQLIREALGQADFEREIIGITGYRYMDRDQCAEVLKWVREGYAKKMEQYRK